VYSRSAVSIQAWPRKEGLMPAARRRGPRRDSMAAKNLV